MRLLKIESGSNFSCSKVKSERLEQIDRIFQSALDLAPGERADFLDTQCGGDAELRAEVESLLAAHQSAGDFIEDSASDVAASLLEKQPRHARQVGQYKIEKLLDEGGMGEVYLATDRLGRRVALKLLSSRLYTDQQHVARFLQEAQTLLTLNHPNIVTIYDIGETDGTYYIASELIEGENLRQLLKTADLELAAILKISIQVATALAAAHEKGVVHRDVKPENVMVRRDGYVKVLDFGVAKLTEEFAGPVDGEGPTRLKVETAEGLVIGTATYMSPEQARGQPVDARTDIWSCGVMLYEMLTGQPPFGGGSVAETVARILDRDPPPLTRYMTEAPAELQRIVNKALVKNREERYQSIKDLLLDLKALKHELEFAAKLERSGITGEAESKEFKAPRSGRRVSQAKAMRLEGGTLSTRRASSAEYLVGEIKHHKRSAALIAGVLLLATLGTSYWFFIHRRSSNLTTNVTSIDSIAVMPFENVTHDQKIEYFADGVTESLINSLSQLPRMKVIARNSVFSYKNQTLNLQQVARQLNVQALLTGRVLMQGDMVDVRVELTDAQNNTQLWGGHYAQKTVDIFAMQDEIARQVTDTLRVRLTGGQQEQLTKRYTENAEAYRLYLQGRFYFNEFSEENLSRAIPFFDQAIALDPRYALAYAARGETFFTMGDLSSPMNEAIPRAKQDIATALRIDDKLVEARTTLANIKFQYDWDFAGAEADFKQVIALNHNYAEAHHQYVYYLALMGRPMEGVAEIKLAQQLDPVNPAISVDACVPYALARQFDQCIAQSRKALEMFPNFFLPHMTLGYALVNKGDYSTGIIELQKAKAMEPTPHLIGVLGYAYARSRQKDKARKLLAELKELSKRRYVSPYWMAVIHAGLDEKDEAFTWLEKAYQERSFFVLWIKMDPMVDSLRSDARFIDLERRIGFPR